MKKSSGKNNKNNKTANYLEDLAKWQAETAPLTKPRPEESTKTVPLNDFQEAMQSANEKYISQHKPASRIRIFNFIEELTRSNSAAKKARASAETPTTNLSENIATPPSSQFIPSDDEMEIDTETTTPTYSIRNGFKP